jgi:hypothetical protein
VGRTRGADPGRVQGIPLAARAQHEQDRVQRVPVGLELPDRVAGDGPVAPRACEGAAYVVLEELLVVLDTLARPVEFVAEIRGDRPHGVLHADANLLHVDVRPPLVALAFSLVHASRSSVGNR